MSFDTNIKNGYGQKLLTKAILNKVPALYDQDDKGDDAIVHIKYFLGGWTWYITELNAETGEAFGMVYSPLEPNGELGYISLEELVNIGGRFAVERDQYFNPTPLSKIIRYHV